MNKVTENTTHHFFTEVFRLPFSIREATKGNLDENGKPIRFFRICLDETLIISSVLKNNYQYEECEKLTETVVKILNKEDFKLKLKNIEFN